MSCIHVLCLLDHTGWNQRRWRWWDITQKRLRGQWIIRLDLKIKLELKPDLRSVVCNSFQSLDYDRCINEPYLEVLEGLDNKVKVVIYHIWMMLSYFCINKLVSVLTESWKVWSHKVDFGLCYWSINRTGMHYTLCLVFLMMGMYCIHFAFVKGQCTVLRAKQRTLSVSHTY